MTADRRSRPRRSARSISVTMIVLAAIAGLVALGVWQLYRLQWKLDLIARTEARLAAPPVAAPGPARWATIGTHDVYTRLVITGRYRAGADTLVQATTVLGGGYWVLTPLDVGGFTVLINRGFVTPQRRGTVPPPGGPVRVTGLLRVTEPGGGFLRENDPSTNRWYSRDVAAIARLHGIERVAPYFIDVSANGTGWPRGGLTVVTFPNTHLVYALTWFSMAGLLAFLAWRASRPAKFEPA